MTQKSTPSHPWRFFRAGGFDQVLLESGADLEALSRLDQKLWVALSCPIQGVEFDRRTLALLDGDGDGHVRAPEVLAAIAWCRERLDTLDLLLTPGDSLPLAAIRRDTPEGERVLSAARAILGRLGREESATVIGIAEACAHAEVFAASRFNGDGIITPRSADDCEQALWIERIIACHGSRIDSSGEAGIDRELLDTFSGEVIAWLEWWTSGNVLGLGPGLLPRTTLCATWNAVHGKVDDYFVRCRLAAFDPRAAGALSSSDDRLLALAPLELAPDHDAIAALPLAHIDERGELDLTARLNPAWSAAIASFREQIVVPCLGETNILSDDAWQQLKAAMAPLVEWWMRRSESPVATFGPEELERWRSAALAEQLAALIEADQAMATEAEAVTEVETLARYCRDLVPFLNNFVSFRDFYTRRDKSIFQTGTLYLDGRSCDLCVAVTDPPRHTQLATLSRLFLVYCDCTRNGGASRRTIAAAITSGDTDQLIVGRNGLFYDRNGDDWDATVVRVIEHPISLRQSFWSPYRRIARMVGEQLQKLAAARNKATEEKAAHGIVHGAQKVGDEKTPPAPFDVAKFAGIFAAIGLAVGAIGTTLASVVTGLLRLAWWQIPLAVLGAMLAISGPAMLIDWFKLQQRNLGPLLDANGWAVNARARINLPFGATLTSVARLPLGARPLLNDPFAEKRHGWKIWLLLAALAGTGLLAWLNGWIGGE